MQMPSVMKRKRKQLTLSRTTVRDLTQSHLNGVAGGTSGTGSVTYRANGRMILGVVSVGPTDTIPPTDTVPL